ncbi:Hypothetical protein, putative [Bodo saltans]|uniref:Membrane-associated protein n=1 Tax=Bodo saltans TaxID=75058 RepID=A0A0S4JA11_BODSA|nr:Hypothetical protein, putative [Bodo saltans]|eukprot:CUG86938.1 Hypothetical protein, putative [Bodo saltans]
MRVAVSSQSVVVFVAMLVAHVIARDVLQAPSSGQCTFQPNRNITADNMVVAKFFVSSSACCNYCTNTPGCVAAVYMNYYCHLKRVASPVVVLPGATAIVQAPPTTTAAPVVNNIVIIREVSCEHNAQCDVTNDHTCVTTVYYNNTCRGKELRTCNTLQTNIEAGTFAGPPCEGTEMSVGEATGVCAFYSPTQAYLGHYCDVVPAPVIGGTVRRTQCSTLGCNSATCVTPEVFTTGVCSATSQLNGQYVKAYCFPTYVVYQTFSASGCAGDPDNVFAEPSGQCFTTGASVNYVENTCYDV